MKRFVKQRFAFMTMTTLSKSNWDETNIMQINFTLNRLYMSDYDSENQTTFLHISQTDYLSKTKLYFTPFGKGDKRLCA